MNIEFLLNNILNKALITDRIKQPNSNKISVFVSNFMESNKLISPVISSKLGFAKFIKNPKGKNKIKHLTLGKEYNITKRFNRSKQRHYNPNLCDGFEIIKDNGESCVYFSNTLFKVSRID